MLASLPMNVPAACVYPPDPIVIVLPAPCVTVPEYVEDMVMLFAWAFVLIVQAFVLEAENSTSSVEVGTPDGVQFAAVFQLLGLPDVQVLVAACAMPIPTTKSRATMINDGRIFFFMVIGCSFPIHRRQVGSRRR